jgi:hypothetical protein
MRRVTYRFIVYIQQQFQYICIVISVISGRLTTASVVVIYVRDLIDMCPSLLFTFSNETLFKKNCIITVITIRVNVCFTTENL